MTPEQITELKRQVAVAEYERNLILDDIAKKDAEIAELKALVKINKLEECVAEKPETREEMLDRFAEEDGEAEMPGGFQ